MGIPRICNHIKPDGTPCRDVAAGRARLCRSHQRQAARDHRRVLALNRGRTVRLGPLDSPAAIRAALNRIIQLLAAGTLPVERAGHALFRVNRALSALRQRDHTKNAVIPSGAQRSRGTPAFVHPGMIETVDDLLNSFTAAFNPFTMELEFAPVAAYLSPLPNPLEPRTMTLEPVPTHLPSPPHHPTIEKTPPVGASFNPQSTFSRITEPSTTTRIPRLAARNEQRATHNEQRITDNAST